MLGPDWQNYFDLIIIQAQKPSFFTTNYRAFREYSPKSDRLKWKPVDQFQPSKVYAGVSSFSSFANKNAFFYMLHIWFFFQGYTGRTAKADRLGL